MDQTDLAKQPDAASPRLHGEPVESEAKPQPSQGFVQRRLPWLIAGGALLLYGLMLPHWITFLGLPPLARAVGWDWHPALHVPLQFLVTYPFRWLSPDIAAFHRRAKTKIHWGCGDGDLQGVGEFSSTGFYLCSSNYAFGGSTTFTRGSRSGGSIDLWRCQRLERSWRGWRDCQHQEYGDGL